MGRSKRSVSYTHLDVYKRQGVDSAVNLGLSLIPAHFAVAGLFIIACFISVSMGTSMGTIAALASIAAGISEKTGFSLAVCIAAVVCGAMFGDNLSMISDTTIAAVKTQGCEMKDKFKANFLIVLPAAVLTVVFFWFITRGAVSYTHLVSHSEASAYVSRGSRIAGSTPGSSVGTSKLKCGIVFVGASRIAPLKIASMIPRVSLMEIRFPVPFHPVFTR